MSEKQTYLQLECEAVEAKAAELKQSGYRIVQIGATRTADHLEVNYSFDRDYEFINLKVVLPLSGGQLESLSGVYWNAFLYENEVHDLFGIAFTGLPLDYRGNFYRTAKKTPFNPPAEVPKNG